MSHPIRKDISALRAAVQSPSQGHALDSEMCELITAIAYVCEQLLDEVEELREQIGEA